jgi:hypothetical protein
MIGLLYHPRVTYNKGNFGWMRIGRENGMTEKICRIVTYPTLQRKTYKKHVKMITLITVTCFCQINVLTFESTWSLIILSKEIFLSYFKLVMFSTSMFNVPFLFLPFYPLVSFSTYFLLHIVLLMCYFSYLSALIIFSKYANCLYFGTYVPYAQYSLTYIPHKTLV